VQFALLPEGQDPDDLVRSAGREAVQEVLAGARPLADMLWARETEASSFDTPERRAAFEARLQEAVRSIDDDSVRKYYTQEFSARLRAQLAPPRDRERSDRASGFSGGMRSGNYRGTSRGTPGAWPRGRPGVREPLPQSSQRLRGSPIVRGFRSALPPREALILVAVVNHPWILEHHAEEFSELEFLNPDAEQLRRAILDAATEAGAAEPDGLRATIVARGLSAVVTRVEASITHPSDWPARSDAAVEDVAQWWAHVVTLHRKQRTLNRELKDAERALGEEPTDANLAWLRDVQGRLSALDGTEALIEGFGASSGRLARNL
jgi:DNA primase